VFSFPVLLSCLLGCLAVLTCSSRLSDPDLWWHLRLGQIIWSSHVVPTVDVLSYSTNHHPVVPQEWLSQLSIYLAFLSAGYTGLMIWLCFTTAAVLIAGYILCSLYTRNPKIGFLGALVIWFFATAGLSVRPQMIGYLCLLLELIVLQLGCTRSYRCFFALPILFAIWINCHSSFFLGLIVAAAFLVASRFTFTVGNLHAMAWTPNARRMFSWALVLSLCALFANPVGIRQVLYPLDTLFHQPLGLSLVSEWQPLVITSSRGLATIGLLAGIGLIVVLRRSTLYLHEVLLLGLGAWMAFHHTRLVFAFGILAAPLLSRLLSDFWDGYRIDQEKPLPNAVLIAISVLCVIWAFPSRSNLYQQVAEANPVDAVRFIQENHLSGNMLNEYAYGGYLTWSAPEHPVFIDGRSDIYEWTGVLAQFQRWEALEEDPNRLLDAYHISFCILATRSPMAYVMTLLPGWRKTYSDDISIIFVRAQNNNRWH
jgi:hypothetical protein